MTAGNATAARGSVDLINEALLTASRLLAATSARSIVPVDESTTIIRRLPSSVTLFSRGPVNLATRGGLTHGQPPTTRETVGWLVRAGMINRRPQSNSRRELTAERTGTGHQVLLQVTARHHHEIAEVIEKSPPWDRRARMGALALIAASGEVPAHTDVDSWADR
jgi:hypothetical protein